MHNKIFLKVLFAISLTANACLILFIVIFEKNDSETKLIYFPGEPCFSYNKCESALTEIMKNGSDSAYSVIDAETSQAGVRLFPYALIAANKWNKNYACMDIYYELTAMYNCDADNIETMDSASRKMALEYLIKAYEYSSDSTENQKSYKENVHETILTYSEKGKYITILNNRYVYTGVNNSKNSNSKESDLNKKSSKYEILETNVDTGI